jgi:hypothetical protein
VSKDVTVEQVKQSAARLPPLTREAQADELLRELDAIAESIDGEFDSAADIRQIREERADRL